MVSLVCKPLKSEESQIDLGIHISSIRACPSPQICLSVNSSEEMASAKIQSLLEAKLMQILSIP